MSSNEIRFEIFPFNYSFFITSNVLNVYNARQLAVNDEKRENFFNLRHIRKVPELRVPWHRRWISVRMLRPVRPAAGHLQLCTSS